MRSSWTFLLAVRWGKARAWKAKSWNGEEGREPREEAIWVFSCFNLLPASLSKDCPMTRMAGVCNRKQRLRGQDGYFWGRYYLILLGVLVFFHSHAVQATACWKLSDVQGTVSLVTQRDHLSSWEQPSWQMSNRKLQFTFKYQGRGKLGELCQIILKLFFYLCFFQ